METALHKPIKKAGNFTGTEQRPNKKSEYRKGFTYMPLQISHHTLNAHKPFANKAYVK